MTLEAVRVRLVDLDSADAEPGVLDRSERDRAAALRDPADRRRYVAAHTGLRRAIGQATGLEAGAVRILRAPCAACGEAHGRPTADDVSFSLSRSGRWAAIALAPAGVACGIDIEVAQEPSRLAPIADQILAPGDEPGDLLRTWVRKEALLKATGDGLTRPMHTVSADQENDLGSIRDLTPAELPAGVLGALAVARGFTDATLVTGRVHGPVHARHCPESAPS